MKTVTLNIEDNFFHEFMDYVAKYKDKLSIDKNIEYDPHFFERQKDLKKTREAINNGTMKLLSEDEYSDEVDKLFSTLNNEN